MGRIYIVTDAYYFMENFPGVLSAGPYSYSLRCHYTKKSEEFGKKPNFIKNYFIERKFGEPSSQYSENIKRKTVCPSFKFCYTKISESTFGEGSWQYSENIERGFK